MRYFFCIFAVKSLYRKGRKETRKVRKEKQIWRAHLRQCFGFSQADCYTSPASRMPPNQAGSEHFPRKDPMLPTFTIGIEEEYQTVDPVTRDLRSHIHAEIIEKGKLLLQERVKAEMHQSVVEVGTSVCSNIKDAKEEVKKLRRDMIALARENGLRLASAATHPFADWRVQEITEDVRYKNIVEDLQLVARANLIFGLHVHIGVEDRETAIQLMNHARYFLPHILALSTNSPFWLGMDTGLKSYRCKVFDKFPRTNIPDYFPSWGEYENFIKLLIKTNCIDNAKKIWWDIRPHPFFNTLEFRVCDIPMRVEETIALAALIQATIAKLYKLYDRQPGVPPVSPRSDHGEQVAGVALWTGGKLIDFGKQTEVPARELVLEISGVHRRCGGRTRFAAKRLNYIHKILERWHWRRPAVAGISRDRRSEKSCGLHHRRNGSGTGRDRSPGSR